MRKKSFQERDPAFIRPLQTARPLSELKPLHNLPRGKNTWNPAILREWWFWPSSVLFLIALYHLYPLFWNAISP